VKKFEGCLIVSDMDATLLTDKHKISEENRQAIEYFINNGGMFTVSTGRMVEAVKMYLPSVPINVPAILHNGAKLYDFEKEKTLFAKSIEEERKSIFRRAYEDFPEIGMEVYTSSENVYIYRECSETARFKRRKYEVTFGVPDEVWKEPWIKFLFIGEKAVINRFEKIYRSDYDSGYAVRSGDKYLDIVADGVSKGIALGKLADMLKAKKTIAVGDNMNDISMLEAADIGAAVENAEKSVKATADIIVPDNNHHAIKYIIENIA
jgi:Cof subfamily protein (haloacid dehalogenase superfamily)